MALSSKQFSARVLKWYEQNGRKNLPWQKKRNAYRVWVSEIMLQQTQVATVIPYYDHFMKSFPTVKDLAAASDDDVMAHWSGLGYYSRARNLHKTAKIVVDEHKGKFPKTQDGLEALPGIGRSTAGAILAQAYQLPAAILDGNVKRVLARYYAVEGWPGNKPVHDELWVHAEHNTPSDNIIAYTQGMMDLGSMVCTRSKPLCNICPLASHCAAKASGNPVQFPHKKPKKDTPVREGYLYIVQNPKGQVYLQKRPPVGIWGGLWSLPQSEVSPEEALAQWGLANADFYLAEKRRHTFSHYHFDYHPVHIQASQFYGVKDEPGEWFELQAAQDQGLPAPVRKLLLECLNEEVLV